MVTVEPDRARRQATIQAVDLRCPGCCGIQLAARLLLLLVYVVGLGGCAVRQPPRAAMVPWTVTGNYGYAEKQIGPDFYQVTFTSPRLQAQRDPENSHGLESERLRVFELALWRAAELAREKGYPAFIVEQDNRDIEVTVQGERVYPVAPYPFLFGGPWHWRGGYWPYGYWPGYATGVRSRESVTGRVKSELTVKMLRAKSQDALDTATTLDRLRRQYGSAQFPRAIYTN